MVDYLPNLVTGGTGFLGKRLVMRLLGMDRNVTVLARRPDPELQDHGVRFILTSLDDAAAVRAACAGMGTVFHVASKVGVWGRYRDFFRTNVLGTRAIIEGCREHGVKRLVYTSTPSVIYNGLDHTGTDETHALTRGCPSPYPVTKAIAEKEVLAANCPALRTIALRPHLIWGVGDPHLVPRILASARTGRLKIVGGGENIVDLTHVENAVDAHILAEDALIDFIPLPPGQIMPEAAGRAYFISNGQPVRLWPWINQLLVALGEKPIEKRVERAQAEKVGLMCELAWRILPLAGEPPMTRFIASELSLDHWFDITAARKMLGYGARVSMDKGLAQLVAHLKATEQPAR